MKKIDTWLSIQRYMTEASKQVVAATTADVELIGTMRRSPLTARGRRVRAQRRFKNIKMTV